jgi:hypothetical protein
MSLLKKSKINCALIEGDWGRDKMRDSTDVCVGVLVRLTSLTMRVEGLIDGREQQMTNWRFAWHCKQGET